MRAATGNGEPRLVPMQAVYLFTNLDESASSAAWAPRAGLWQHAGGGQGQRTAGSHRARRRGGRVFDPRCFPGQPGRDVREVLARYREQGIDPVFQDLTTELGVPATSASCTCPKAGWSRPRARHCRASRAALSALTETPFPFPAGPASAPGPGRILPVRMLEDLPDHSTGSAAGDLALLEAILENLGATRPSMSI
jgi:ribosomal protein S12 methylthiotransferase accessory factor